MIFPTHLGRHGVRRGGPRDGSRCSRRAPEVQLEQRIRIPAVVPQRLGHLIGAKVRERRAVDLLVAQALGVQRPELPLVRPGQVGEEVLVAGVRVGAVALAGVGRRWKQHGGGIVN